MSDEISKFLTRKAPPQNEQEWQEIYMLLMRVPEIEEAQRKHHRVTAPMVGFLEHWRFWSLMTGLTTAAINRDTILAIVQAYGAGP